MQASLTDIRQRVTGIRQKWSLAKPTKTMLEELKVASSFQRATFVQDQGWATMPGETEPDNRVARECATQLMLINE